jgi:hypothetical protein
VAETPRLFSSPATIDLATGLPDRAIDIIIPH